ncbi:hypothetical protein KU39_3p12 (plasmid) [Piscirickettsia salmonis]|uniref:Uncharacterized protein n=1 Tax=Piscirickettsia salmonis TaxID=1238 RepID=A0AAC8VLG0_PISSA|nr:DUF1561 family protein [Piscirickettsia salmonis]ALB24474.1 hypothetical protein KU39_3p12 [Piscirickettsia salmonis]
MNLLKIFSFICINISFITFIFASPGPIPPKYFYRADTRPPNEIFGNSESRGSGFPTWARTRSIQPNYDILLYASGVTVSPGHELQRIAGWVSTAGSIDRVLFFLNQEIPERGQSRPDYWVYETAAIDRAYNMNWMLEDYLESDHSASDLRIARNLLTRYYEEDEWVVRDGIRSDEIHRARLYRFNQSMNEYEATGEYINNPHFVAPSLPAPQTSNPADTSSEDADVDFFAYINNTSSSLEEHTDTSHATVNYAMSCAGTGASLPSTQKRSVNSGNNTPRPAPRCDYSEKSLQKTKFKDLPTIPSQLITTQGGYCLAPTQSRDSSMKTSRSYLYAQTCSNVESQKAIYDTLGRVAFSKSQFGIPLCMTAPENVIKGDDKWDYVEFWPCDIHNTYQKWDVRDGKLKPRLNKDLSIQWYGDYGIISKSSGTDIVLDANKMSKYFFKTPWLCCIAQKVINSGGLPTLLLH